LFSCLPLAGSMGPGNSKVGVVCCTAHPEYRAAGSRGRETEQCPIMTAGAMHTSGHVFQV
jgi:hypothetical protein